MDDDSFLDAEFPADESRALHAGDDILDVHVKVIHLLQRILQFLFIQAYDVHAGIHGFQA